MALKRHFCRSTKLSLAITLTLFPDRRCRTSAIWSATLTWFSGRNIAAPRSRLFKVRGYCRDFSCRRRPGPILRVEHGGPNPRRRSSILSPCSRRESDAKPRVKTIRATALDIFHQSRSPALRHELRGCETSAGRQRSNILRNESQQCYCTNVGRASACPAQFAANIVTETSIGPLIRRSRTSSRSLLQRDRCMRKPMQTRHRRVPSVLRRPNP